MNDAQWTTALIAHLVSAPIVIEGRIEIWDDGSEQQGLYVKTEGHEGPHGDYRPLSEFLLDLIPEEEQTHGYELGRLRVTLQFEEIASDTKETTL